MQQKAHSHPSSYRDPSGCIFEKNGMLYRQVNTVFKEHFDHFINSGCYQHLVSKQMLVEHKEVNEIYTSENWYKTLSPHTIPYISYPYEWCFDMLKDAALLTLQLVKECIPFNVMLKDATPYNIQWLNGKIIFIDTLSFEKYDEAQPWIAYRQFCESFLAPLLLMHYNKMPLQQLQLAYPDGIPLPVVKQLLPARSKFSFYSYLHIHLHGSYTNSKNIPDKKIVFSKKKLFNLTDSLQSLIRSLRLNEKETIWSAYYKEATQRHGYIEQKKNIIDNWITQLNNIGTAADLGANQGEFSYLTAKKGIRTLAFDFDHASINALYKEISLNSEKNIQPLIIDLSHPSPAIGVNNRERASFIERTHVDLILALALVHHLAIAKNISFSIIAKMFRKLGSHLIIEFVPKEDEKVKYMMRNKKDIYTHYNEESFIKAFALFFPTIEKQPIPGSERILFLMKP